VAAPAAALLITTGLAAPASASTLSFSVLTASRPSKVTVPSSYVYNPKLGPRHDYCTLAPDEFPAPLAPNADFRGPCARHDLCYDSKSSKKSCDKRLRKNMYRNCEHYYGKYNPLRASCKATALVYWAAVTANR
jgi:hypothetical protein